MTEATAPERTPLLTSREAAAALGVSRDTLMRLVGEGRLFPVRLRPGGAFRFRPSDLDALVERSREGGDRAA